MRKSISALLSRVSRRAGKAARASGMDFLGSLCSAGATRSRARLFHARGYREQPENLRRFLHRLEGRRLGYHDTSSSCSRIQEGCCYRIGSGGNLRVTAITVFPFEHAAVFQTRHTRGETNAVTTGTASHQRTCVRGSCRSAQRFFGRLHRALG